METLEEFKLRIKDLTPVQIKLELEKRQRLEEIDQDFAAFKASLQGLTWEEQRARFTEWQRSQRPKPISGSIEEIRSHLVVALEAAVPLHIMQLKQQGGPSQEEYSALPKLSELLGEHGDDLLYGGLKPGNTAKLFNSLARAIAVLSFSPGGITLFNEHWEANP